MQAFLEYCAPAMSNENVARRLLPPLECAIGLLGQMPDIVRTFGGHLAQPATVMRLRLYRCLALLPPTAYSSEFRVFETSTFTISPPIRTAFDSAYSGDDCESCRGIVFLSDWLHDLDLTHYRSRIHNKLLQNRKSGG